MCIYTVKKQKIKKFLKGDARLTECPKIRRLRRKGFCKKLTKI